MNRAIGPTQSKRMAIACVLIPGCLNRMERFISVFRMNACEPRFKTGRDLVGGIAQHREVLIAPDHFARAQVPIPTGQTADLDGQAQPLLASEACLLARCADQQAIDGQSEQHGKRAEKRDIVRIERARRTAGDLQNAPGFAARQQDRHVDQRGGGMVQHEAGKRKMCLVRNIGRDNRLPAFECIS
ncbi:hypothetical protein XAUB_04390 [Xanthomonas citri pv. aurantifolii str. ICPB 11122]|nr:hypothetical protein XAUB_04390 [Xanthomonas citri pv. aurantifolii str. ICPB 11122]